MRTGPLPPHLKEQVLVNIANAKTPNVITSQVDTPMTVEPPQMDTSQVHTNNSLDGDVLCVTTPQMDTSLAHTNIPTANTPGLTEPNVSSTANQLPDKATSVPDDNTSDGGSYTSTLPNVFNIDMDGLEPLTVGPWVAINHLTGEIIAGTGGEGA